MSTSFVVVPPVKFRDPEVLASLTQTFHLASLVSPWDVWAVSGCSLEEARNLLTFLERQGHGHIRQGTPCFFKASLPITFVASLESKQFAAGGRR